MIAPAVKMNVCIAYIQFFFYIFVIRFKKNVLKQTK